MRFLADEGVDARLVAHLRTEGHEVVSILEDSPGTPDPDVMARAHREGIVMISEDKDMGELAFREHRPHSGVLLLRLDGTDIATKRRLLTETLSAHASELPGSFSVLTPKGLRIRPSSANDSTDPA